MKQVDMLIINAAELLPFDDVLAPVTGSVLSAPKIVKNGAVAVDKGIILQTGRTDDILKNFSSDTVIEANGMTVTPGLVDPHTHIVFASTREEEFAMRLQGMSYQQIADIGGGIKNSVKKLRASSKAELKNNAVKYADAMLANGTTTIETKSGYGLNTENELKMLEVINELRTEHPLDIVPTFLGAHDFPPEYSNNHKGYVELLINEMIPAIAKSGLAEFCDIFCEKGYFEVEDSRTILSAAKDAGFKLKLHADEFIDSGGAELAGELGAVSADHLMAISDSGISAIKASGTIPVILPGTTFFLGLSAYAPARKMIEHGLPVALSTDFNPGSSMICSIQTIMAIATTHLKMTPAEALTASTVNSAFAIDRFDRLGSLTSGKQADIVIWNVPTHKQLGYFIGHNLAHIVIKKGGIKSCIM